MQIAKCNFCMQNLCSCFKLGCVEYIYKYYRYQIDVRFAECIGQEKFISF